MKAWLCVAILVLLCAAQASAWWCYGHMLVAEIARQHLNKDVETRIQKIVGDMSKTGKFPQSPDMVQGACWCDDIKPHLSMMGGWHFRDTPIVEHGWKGELPHIEEQNVEKVLNTLTYELNKDRKGYSDWELGFAVLNTIHFYGDIAQPLHVSTYVSERFKKGDYGGNLFNVTMEGIVWKLHFVWDSVCGLYQDEPKRPMGKTDMDKLSTLATELAKKYTFPKPLTEVWNTTKMRVESYEHAVNDAYGTLKFGQVLSKEYLDNCVNVSHSQLTLAGLRLASELNKLFHEDVNDDGGMSTAAKSIVFGGGVLLVALLVAGVFFIRRRKMTVDKYENLN